MLTAIKEHKCVVWDLDNTIWDGILSEAKSISIKENVINVIKELDRRGILQSIASKNNYDDAMSKLKELNISEYFLYPQINWNSKSSSIKKIQQSLNIGIDSFAFIDDQKFEREEVKSALGDITCYDTSEIDHILEYKAFNPSFLTDSSKYRRKMYMESITRKKDEETYEGTPEEFLTKLKMKFTISEATEDDLKRAQELTIRTHQLNATGITYDYDELNAFRVSPDYSLYVCELTDIYGSYGKIGVSLVEKKNDTWHIKLLLMSCRVMSRGVGTILLTYIINEAKKNNKKLFADFKKTDRNKMMYITYKLANFKEASSNGEGYAVLKNDLDVIQRFPKYIEVEAV